MNQVSFFQYLPIHVIKKILYPYNILLLFQLVSGFTRNSV